MDKFLGVKTESGEGCFYYYFKFTREARKIAAENDITLVDGEKLIELLKEKRIGYKEKLELVMDKDFFDKV